MHWTEEESSQVYSREVFRRRQFRVVSTHAHHFVWHSDTAKQCRVVWVCWYKKGTTSSETVPETMDVQRRDQWQAVIGQSTKDFYTTLVDIPSSLLYHYTTPVEILGSLLYFYRRTSDWTWFDFSKDKNRQQTEIFQFPCARAQIDEVLTVWLRIFSNTLMLPLHLVSPLFLES